MLSIKNNLMAGVAARHLNKTSGMLGRSVERLSSGLRINSSKDDAAGLAARELIRVDIAALRQGSRNAADAISMLQVAEGAMGVIDDILVRMRELAEQAATDSYSDDQKQIMQDELDDLIAEVDRIAQNTDFNDNNLLSATGTTFDIALGLGLGATKVIQITSAKMDSEGLGIGGDKEYISAEEWVPTEATNLMSNASTAAQTWTIQIVGQDDIDVAFALSSTKTLAEVVTAINNGSRGTDQNYDAAEAVYNSDTDTYTLKVSAKDAGAAADISFVANTFIDWATGLQQAGEDVAIGDFHNEDGSGTAINIKTAPTAAIDAIVSAIEEKDKFRAELGYKMTRLESASTVIDLQAENLTAAESRISDVDVATEMATMTRNQVLAQAGITMLARANMMPQMALQLLG